MSHHPHHQSLRLENFTVFRDVSFQFVSGINAFVGRNGTGKTHVMKLLYAFQLAFSPKSRIYDSLQRVFQTDALSQLIAAGAAAGEKASVQGTWDGRDWRSVIDGHEAPTLHAWILENWGLSRPVFIPSLDMLGHTRRFVSTYDQFEIDFDQTQRDIVSLLLSPERRQPYERNAALDELALAVGGSLEEEGERFYLRTGRGRHPMPLVAEGIRKIATLHQLIRNGWLQPGSVLFWDEPEVNLSPTLMDEVVAALLALAESGVQIFLATHSYVILKELDLQSSADTSLRYFAFAPGEHGTEIHPADDYASLDPNPIAEQYDRLYDLELTRATGRKRRA